MTDEKSQYKCEKCGATFTDPEMLEKHRKVHMSGHTGAAAATQEQGGESGQMPLQGQPRTPPSSTTPEPMPSPTEQPR